MNDDENKIDECNKSVAKHNVEQFTNTIRTVAIICAQPTAAISSATLTNISPNLNNSTDKEKKMNKNAVNQSVDEALISNVYV